MKYLKIKYRNSCDFGGTIFQKPGFWYVMYLPVDVGKSMFEFVEEGREDGEKNFISDFKRTQKVYEFNTIVSDFQLDALASIAMHDTIEVTLRNGEVARVHNFKLTQNGWNDNGSEVNITVNFTVKYDVVTGCCNNEVISYTPCLKCESMTAGLITDTSNIYVYPTSVPAADRSWYFVYSGAEPQNCTLYQFRYRSHLVGGATVIGKWIEHIGASDSCKYFTDSTDSIVKHFYWDGKYWQPALFIRDYTVLTQQTVNIRVWSYPNCFVQLYYSIDGVNYVASGAPTSSATAQNAGITSLKSGTVVSSFKALIYNNNCNYGYTNVITVNP